MTIRSRTYHKSYNDDLPPDKAIGVLLPFNTGAYRRSPTAIYTYPTTRDAKPFQLSYSTEEQAISNLINLLLTRKGERYMQPNFGSLIPDFLFEPITDLSLFNLEQSIREDIEYWLPYIFLNTLRVVTGNEVKAITAANDHTVGISISFKVTESGANRVIVLFVNDDRIEAQLT